MDPAEALATASRFQAALQDAVARERIVLAWGTALRSPDLPGVHDANLARLESPAAADEVVADLERVRGDLWFDHLFVADEAVGERLRPALEELGFHATSFAVMAWDGAPAGPEPGAREVAQGEAHAIRVAINTEELPPEAGEYAPHIARLQERIAGEVPTRVFAAPADGEIGALASLYVVGAVAQIEEVSTLRARRGEGLGGMVVRAALHAALDTAPELVFIVVAEESWVKDWYARLGFQPVGRSWRFSRTRA